MKMFPFIMFVIVMTGTPGPGNLAMMTIGQTTGFKSAIPFLCGTTIGFLALNAAVSLGLGEIFSIAPFVAGIMKIAGTVYIIYLACKIIKINFSSPDVGKRFTLVEGILLHPTSPKSWAMSLAAFSQFSNPNAGQLLQVFSFLFIFFIGQISFHSFWCIIGETLIHLFRKQNMKLFFSVCMTTLMVGATLYSLFISSN